MRPHISVAHENSHQKHAAQFLPPARGAAHGPVHGAAADAKDEVLQDLFTARRVRDFGMKLQSIKLSVWVLHRGEVATFCSPHNAKTFRQRRHFVAMAVPNVELTT